MLKDGDSLNCSHVQGFDDGVGDDEFLVLVNAIEFVESPQRARLNDSRSWCRSVVRLQALDECFRRWPDVPDLVKATPAGGLPLPVAGSVQVRIFKDWELMPAVGRVFPVARTRAVMM